MPKKNMFDGAAPVLIAICFLVVPIITVLANTRKQNVPTADYAKAIREAMQPDSHTSHSLVSVNLDQPVTVVTWTRQKQVPDYKNGTTPTYKNTWVTVVPRLKSFCQDYVKSHGSDPRQLTLRLEQRLGLPSGSNYDSFVEVTVDPKDKSTFFRPCDDPSINSNSCDPPPLPEVVKDKIKALDLKDDKEIARYWLLSTYYRSFASREQYPWTSLGYTFDWAPKEDDSADFIRWGESEFVIAPGTPIKFVSAADTVTYCTP